MIGRLNHVAIAVPDLAGAAAQYRDTLGARVGAAAGGAGTRRHRRLRRAAQHQDRAPAPLGEHSPIAGFLARNPAGGIHHLCYEVEDIAAARDRLLAQGARVLGDGEPKIGAHGKPVLFLHPKDFAGTLVELEEA